MEVAWKIGISLKKRLSPKVFFGIGRNLEKSPGKWTLPRSLVFTRFRG